MSLCRYAARRLVLNRYQFGLRDMATWGSISIRRFFLRSCHFSTKPVASGLSQHEGEVKKFQADTSKLLDIVAKSLYSDKEVRATNLPRP